MPTDSEIEAICKEYVESKQWLDNINMSNAFGRTPEEQLKADVRRVQAQIRFNKADAARQKLIAEATK